MTLPRTNQLSPTQCNEVATCVKEEFELKDNDDAIIILSIFAQQGATSNNADGNMSINILGKQYKLARVRKAFKKAKCNKGFRKYARAKANEIANVCIKLKIEGNLVAKIKRMFPDLEISQEESYWLSDFQCYNPDVPERLRTLILKTFPKKRNPKR